MGHVNVTGTVLQDRFNLFDFLVVGTRCGFHYFGNFPMAYRNRSILVLFHVLVYGGQGITGDRLLFVRGEPLQARGEEAGYCR